MPLPNTQTQLSLNDIYPDNIRITYQYMLSIPTTPAQIDAAMRECGFDRIPRKRLRFTASIEVPDIAGAVTVTASRLGATRPLNFTASFNALSDFHERRTFYGDERAHDPGATNWLHPDDVTGNPRPLLERLYERMIALEPVLLATAEHVAASSENGFASLTEIFVSELELCVDLATADPHFALRRLARGFREGINQIRLSGYRQPTAEGYGELHHDANLIRGYRAAGEEYKLYEKTNRRVRPECGLKGRALSRLNGQGRSETRPRVRITRGGRTETLPRARITRSVANEQDFYDFIGHITAQVLPQFNALLHPDIADADEHGSLFELIALVGPVFRQNAAVLLQSTLHALTRTRRVTSATLGPASLRRLVTLGVLTRSARGIYIITPRYRTALRILRYADNRWQVAVMRAAGMTEINVLPTPAPRIVVRFPPAVAAHLRRLQQANIGLLRAADNAWQRA